MDSGGSTEDGDSGWIRRGFRWSGQQELALGWLQEMGKEKQASWMTPGFLGHITEQGCCCSQRRQDQRRTTRGEGLVYRL